jgi:hypothetical protein
MLLRPGYHAHITLALHPQNPIPTGGDVSHIPVGELIEKLFSFAPHLLPEINELEVIQFDDEKGREKKIIPLSNMRGRPLETFSENKQLRGVTKSGTNREELFYSDGYLLTPPKRLDQYPDNVLELPKEPFHFALHSEFHEYTSSGNVVHKLTPSGSGLLDPAITHIGVQNIAQLLPVHLDTARFGFECYKQRFFGGILGQVPAIQSRLYVEVSQSHIWIMAEEEGLKKRDAIPLAETSIFEALDNSLSELGLHGALCQEIKESLN